jgi:hypothetical protein
VSDLGGGQPTHGAKGEGEFAFTRDRWMTAGEDQPQAIVWLLRFRPLELHELLQMSGPTAQLIQRFASGDGEQPGSRFSRDSVDWPAFQSRQ